MTTAIIVLGVDDFVLLTVLKQFLNHIERHQLCHKDQPILLAVSGGIDSMLMWHLFLEAGFDISVAHCNFQLRGAASDDDEAFIEKMGEAWKVCVHTRKFNTESAANDAGVSIQMAARDLRYRWFQQLIEEYSYAAVATAHHLDDAVETVLLNFAKGSGVEGFTGIPVKNGLIIRPLLFANSEQIVAHAMEVALPWREDESNLTDDYQRNLIRHQVIPVLREINPSLMQTCRQGLQRMQGDLELVLHAFDQWKLSFVTESANRSVIRKEGVTSFKNAVPLLWRYIKQFGFNYTQAAGIVEAINGQSGKRFSSSDHHLVVDRNDLIVTRHADEMPVAMVSEDDFEATVGPWRLQFLKGTETQLNSSIDATLDSDKLTFPLTLRKWKSGDSFQPLGMKHNKKLSDFFIDNKVSVADKEKAVVLESGGTIVYVVGWRIDDRYRITEHTNNVLYVRVEALAD